MSGRRCSRDCTLCPAMRTDIVRTRLAGELEKRIWKAGKEMGCEMVKFVYR